MDILVIAYGCEPNRGSEAGIGWHWTQMMAEEHNVTVITRANNKEVIEDYYRVNGQKKIQYVYYDPIKLIRRIKKKERGLKLFYYFWQKGVIKVVKQLIEVSHYDVVWEMNFGSMTLPTYIGSLSGIKLVIGPVSTKATVPKVYAKAYGKKYYLQNTVKSLLQKALWINYPTWRAFKKANVIAVCDNEYVKLLPKDVQKKAVSVFHNGIEKIPVVLRENDDRKKMEFVFSGRNVAHKNIKLAIDAFYLVAKHNSNFRFRIFTMGDGISDLRKRVDELGLTELVEIQDSVKQNKLFEIYQECDAFVFPSLSEISSTAVVEAMYSGLVPICFDIPGMGCVTDHESCIMISPTEYNQDVTQFAKAVLDLMDNRKLLKYKQKKCIEKSHDAFLWDGRKMEIERIISLV